MLNFQIFSALFSNAIIIPHLRAIFTILLAEMKIQRHKIIRLCAGLCKWIGPGARRSGLWVLVQAGEWGPVTSGQEWYLRCSLMGTPHLGAHTCLTSGGDSLSFDKWPLGPVWSMWKVGISIVQALHNPILTTQEKTIPRPPDPP
jgi:hypothetical protein